MRCDQKHEKSCGNSRFLHVAAKAPAQSSLVPFLRAVLVKVLALTRKALPEGLLLICVWFLACACVLLFFIVCVHASSSVPALLLAQHRILLPSRQAMLTRDAVQLKICAQSHTIKSHPVVRACEQSCDAKHLFAYLD